MEIIILIIVVLFVVVGITVLVKVNRERLKSNPKQEEFTAPASDCCGAHEICDFDEIKADETRIEYYDDEELDEFKNKKEDEYSNNEVEQFREVLYTLKTQEIRYWLLSIERRKINLPTILISEARNLMAEI